MPKPNDKPGTVAPANNPNVDPAVVAQGNAALLPELPNVEPVAPPVDDKAAPANRFDTIFQSYHFAPVDAKTYKNKKGRITKKLADVRVLFAGGFAGIPGKIEAVKNKGAKTTGVEFRFMGNLRTSCVLPMDSAAAAELATYRHSVVAAYSAWLAAQTNGGAVPAQRLPETAITITGIDLSEDDAILSDD